MADRKIALPSYKGKKVLDNLSKGDILKRLSDDEYYTIDNVHNEKLNRQNRTHRIYEMIGFGARFLVEEIIMKKI